MVYNPREAAAFIAAQASDVRIVDEGVKTIANHIAAAVKQGTLQLESFKQNEVLPLDKGLTTEELANWVFLVDALNFSFWTQDGVPKYTVFDQGKKWTGYMAMVSSVNRAIDEGKKIYDPKYYSKLSLADLKEIFRSDTESEMPLFDERVRILQEVGNKLLEKFDGSFANILKLAEGSAAKLIDIVTSEFPSFRDTALYNGVEVKIYKRVQILAADLWVLYRGEGFGGFTDIDNLTIFADYRVPQAMAYFGALQYSDNLMKKLEKEHIFQSGEKEEVEIRGCAIHAAELIVEETRKILASWDLSAAGLNSIKIDFFLWDYRLKNAEQINTPYHRVRCIYY